MLVVQGCKHMSLLVVLQPLQYHVDLLAYIYHKQVTYNNLDIGRSQFTVCDWVCGQRDLSGPVFQPSLAPHLQHTLNTISVWLS